MTYILLPVICGYFMSLHYSLICTLALVLFLIFPGIICIGSEETDPVVFQENSGQVNATEITPPEVISYPGVYYLNNSIIDVDSSVGITIRSDDVLLDGMGCTLNGTGDPEGQRTGILVYNPNGTANNITISNISVSGFESGISLEEITNGIIRNCTLTGNTLYGLKLINVSGGIISDTESSANFPSDGSSGGIGIFITGSDTIEIQSGRILGNGNGDRGDGISITGSSNIFIDKTTISKNAKTGIRGEGVSPGFIIRENIISSNGENGVTLESGCDGLVLSDNRISDNLMTAIEISSCSHGILTGNTAESGRVGLSLSESEDFSMSANEFRGNTINFDVTGSSPVQYIHTIDTSNRADGRSIWYIKDRSGVHIGPSENPSSIYVVNCSDISVSDLILSKNGAGIFIIRSGDVTLSDIAVLDNAFGIRIGYGSSNVRISGTNAEKNLFAGYAVTSSDSVRLSSCAAQNNLIGFLATNSHNITCEDCYAEKQQGLRRRGPSGFQISNSTGIAILNSSSDQNQFDGIYLKDSPETIISTTSFRSNDIAGIAVISDDVELRSNNISVNKAGGVLIYGNNTTLEGNQLLLNKGRGLIIDETSGNLIWNNIFYNSRNVELTGAAKRAIWNTTPVFVSSITGSSRIGGNYWGMPDKTGYSDTCLPGAGGFCKVPYIINANNTDFYPLMYPQFVSLSSGNETQSDNEELAGDLNKNGRVELQDVVLLMEMIGSENRNGMEYDFSRDGRVNLQDVVTLFEKIAGKNPPN